MPGFEKLPLLELHPLPRRTAEHTREPAPPTGQRADPLGWIRVAPAKSLGTLHMPMEDPALPGPPVDHPLLVWRQSLPLADAEKSGRRHPVGSAGTLRPHNRG